MIPVDLIQDKLRGTYSPPANEIAGRQCFQSCLSVSQEPPHVTITHDALDPIVQDPHPLPPDIRPGDSLLVTSCGHHWRPVQSYSFEDPLLVTSGGHY